MEPSQEYQEQLIKLRYLKEQRDMLQGQLEIVNASLGNVINTKNTIENLKDGVKEDDEILVPIGGLVNVKASIKEPEKVLLAVTQDVVIEKDLDEANEYLDKIIEKINQQIQYITTQIRNIDVNLQVISQNFQKGYT